MSRQLLVFALILLAGCKEKNEYQFVTVHSEEGEKEEASLTKIVTETKYKAEWVIMHVRPCSRGVSFEHPAVMVRNNKYFLESRDAFMAVRDHLRKSGSCYDVDRVTIRPVEFKQIVHPEVEQEE